MQAIKALQEAKMLVYELVGMTNDHERKRDALMQATHDCRANNGFCFYFVLSSCQHIGSNLFLHGHTMQRNGASVE